MQLTQLTILDRQRRWARSGCRIAVPVMLMLVMLSGLLPPTLAARDSAYRLYRKAETRLEERAYAEALALINEAIADHDASEVFRMGIQTRHYFPYYLRGLIHLRLGDSLAASTDLLKEQERGKTQQVPALHTRLLNALEEAQALDTEPPRVRIDDIEIVEFELVDGVERVTLRLRGTASDDGSGIVSIVVADREISLTADEGVHRFDQTVLVDASAVAIRVVAQDAAGNVGQSEQPLGLPPLDLGPGADAIHAVVVGVNEYDRDYRNDAGACRDELRRSCVDPANFACYSLPDLSYAARDAERFADLLVRRGVPPGNVHLLVSRDGRREATRESVLQALQAIQPRDSGGKVLFFFSGHGILSARQENLMLLSDAGGWECAGEDDGPTPLERGALGVAEVNQRLMELPVAERYVILDACRSPRLATKSAGNEQPAAGFAIEGIKGLNVVHVEQPGVQSLEPIVFYSTLERKVSIEWNQKASGYFTWFLLQGLRRDLPLDALKRYVQTEVKRQTGQDLCSREAQDCPYLQAPYLQMPEVLEQDYERQSRTFVLR